MKRDEGSVIKEQGSAEGGLVYPLPATHPPSAPHVFSCSPFATETLDFGYQPEDSWQPTWTLSQLNLVGAILSLEEPLSDLCFDSVPSWLNGIDSPKICPTYSLNPSLLPVEVLPSLFRPWQCGGVGVGGAGSQNIPFTKTDLTRLTKGSSCLHLKKLVLISLL